VAQAQGAEQRVGAPQGEGVLHLEEEEGRGQGGTGVRQGCLRRASA
jgi:hypothetical protein